MAQPFVEPCASGIIAAEPCPEALGRALAPRRGMVLAACVLASAMVFIDGSALTVALPKLRAYFGADYATVQWILNGYVLALASLTLAGGALADAYGKARVLRLSCFAFGIASVACAFAPSASWLICARVAQGVTAAILSPTSLALIGATYPERERSRAIGVWASASALTTAGGPVLGGWLTESFGWQWVFAINPPLALIAVGLLALFAPADRPDPRRFDVVGAALLAVALAALAWALSEIGPGESAGGSQMSRLPGITIAAAAVFAIVTLIAYALWERTTDHPMTPPRLLANRAFVGLNVATLLIYCGLSIMFFLVPFDLVERRGLSPTEAGLAFLPFTLAVGLLSRLFGAVADSIGPRIMLIAGPIGAAAAYVMLALGKPASVTFGVLAPMALLGISLAVLVAPLTASIMSALAPADEGLASGVNNTVTRIAQLAGIALAAGVAAYSLGYWVGLTLAAVLSIAGAITVAASVPPATPAGSRPA